MTTNTQTDAELELSGVDLARVVLRAAQEDARRRGAERSAQKPKRWMSPVPRDGRDPVGLGQAIVGLIADRAWETPAAGGSVLDQWPAIAGGLARHVAAMSFDGETGRLDLQPESPAYATHLKFEANSLISKANEVVRAGTVKTIRVLRPGPVGPTPAPPVGDEAKAEHPPQVRSEPRKDSPQGYLDAIYEVRSLRSTRQPNPELGAIAERQSRDSRAREQVGTRDVSSTPIPQRESTELTRRRALRRLEMERQAARGRK
ncbi:DciA family protein [Streptomyces sp. NPDC087532]|uniref:DciA family protein n=1 Tax=Streptomyces sp. NPDC087532 TaxID=3365795 RepID=UPI0037FDE6F5